MVWGMKRGGGGMGEISGGMGNKGDVGGLLYRGWEVRRIICVIIRVGGGGGCGGGGCVYGLGGGVREG